MHHRITQAKIEYGRGPKIFFRVIPLEFFFQFPLSKFCLNVCIRFKLHVWVRHRNAQVKFEFGYAPLIFNRVIPLELIKNRNF
jgi:hypothetical protein